MIEKNALLTVGAVDNTFLSQKCYLQNQERLLE